MGKSGPIQLAGSLFFNAQKLFYICSLTKVECYVKLALDDFFYFRPQICQRPLLYIIVRRAKWEKRLALLRRRTSVPFNFLRLPAMLSQSCVSLVLAIGLRI